jgi:hypothetical protein
MTHLAPEAVDLLRNALQIVALLVFAGFIVLGQRIPSRTGAERRRAINQLLLYTLAVFAGMVVTQRDLWPFSMHPMMAVVTTDRSLPHSMLAARAVDDTGREWMIDEAAFAPLYPPATLGWFDVRAGMASAEERDEVLRFLLGRAEQVRALRRRGGRFPGNRAVLGPLAAPDTNLYWVADAAPRSFRALRIYRVSWVPAELVSGRAGLTRNLLYEYRR